MKEFHFVFFVLGLVHGFRHFLRTPLPSQRWSTNYFVGQRSISRETRCSYAMDDDDRMGNITSRKSWDHRGRAEVNERQQTKHKERFLFHRDNDTPTQDEVDAYFLSEPNPSPGEVVNILERTVKWKKDHKIDVLTGDKLHFVMSSLRSMLFTLNTEQLHNATMRTLMCLQVIPLADIERSGMLRVGLELLHFSRQRNIHFTAIGVARMLYGLVKMASYSPEVRDMLSVLVDVVNNSQEKLGGQAISTSLYGLKLMSSEHDEVRSLLDVLTDKVKNNEDKLSARDISMALYGLQSMSSKHVEVRSILSVLTDKLKDCQQHSKMSAQEVCMALYGLRLMSSDHDEVRSLLTVLTDKAKECQQEFGPQRVAMSLYGLQSMSSEYSEVRKLLIVLTQKMTESQKKFNAPSIIMALHGLQRMCSKHSAVRELLMVLADKITECKAQLTPQKYRKAMFWLQDMSMEHPEARKLFMALASKRSQEENSLDDMSIPMDFSYTYGFVQDQ